MMKSTSSKILGSLLFSLTCLTLSPAVISAATTMPPANTLRITLEKDSSGNFEAFGTDSKGRKEELTLGTFFRTGGQALMEKKYEECLKSEPITIFYEKDPQGTL